MENAGKNFKKPKKKTIKPNKTPKKPKKRRAGI